MILIVLKDKKLLVCVGDRVLRFVWDCHVSELRKEWIRKQLVSNSHGPVTCADISLMAVLDFFYGSKEAP